RGQKHLAVPDPLGSLVAKKLVGDALEILLGTEARRTAHVGVEERLKVCKVVDCRNAAGEIDVVLGGQLSQGLWADRALQVDVEFHLGQVLDPGNQLGS